MKTRPDIRLVLAAFVLVLATVAACSRSDGPTPEATSLPEAPVSTGTPGLVPDQATASDFATQQEAIGQDWAQIRHDIDSWRGDLVVCDSTAAQSALNGFAADFNSVTELARDLPSTPSTREMADLLVTAAEGEAAAFRQLRDRWQPNGVALFELVEERRAAAARAQRTAEAEMVAAARSDSEEASPHAPEPSTTPMADAPTLEPTVVEQEPAMPHRTEDFEAFGRAYQNLLAEWDAFHQLYDEWHSTEGGCDRGAVIQAIDRFSLRMGEIAQRVRVLPQTGYLLSIQALLVEAAERETSAMKALRTSWQPFASDPFRLVEQERANADRLRHQASISLQEFLERF